MFENISLAFQGVWGHKLRSFLTMLGVIIGIASIITIVSTIHGTNQQIKDNLIGSGTNVVNVRLTAGGSPVEFEYTEIPSGIRVISDDMRKKLESLDGVVKASLYRSGNAQDAVYYKNSGFTGTLCGIDTQYFEVNEIYITKGRGIQKDDYENRRKVAVVDQKTAASLFAGAEPIGSIIEIKGEPFIVVGICAKRNTSEPTINSVKDYYTYSGNTSGSVYIPIDCWEIAYKYDEPQSISVKAASTDEMTEAGSNVASVLTKSQITSDGYTYEADDLLDRAASLQNLSKTANTQLIWIACISLLVGGIGVMNIMLVSVTERTREIGLKLAIGASRGRISLQFLTEASVLTLIGGILGVGTGIGLSFMLSYMMGTAVAISIPACMVAVVFSMLIGIAFGFAPAMKASRLNPIEALRHE